ncbi:MAG: hypothetical protein QE278_05790 [Limnobacter sp.]|nr:hypothetical protein [Limnobacter sp.]
MQSKNTTATTTHYSIYFRYFAFQWMFRDVNAKELFQRAAAVRHNLAHRHYLLVYLRRWVFVTLSSFAMGALLEHHGFIACVFFYTVASLSACSLSKILAAWILMGRLEP